MGVEIAALMGFFGLTSAFALVATILAAWMAWRIVEKTGLPGWAGLGAILLTLLPELLRDFGDLRLVVYGAALTLVVMFMPGGLVQAAQLVRARLGFAREAPP